MIVAILSLVACHQRVVDPASPHSYRLTMSTSPDADLQKALVRIDEELGARLGIPAEARACGVLDLTEHRFAAVRPDALFYGASVPKICILLAYFDAYPNAAKTLDPAVQRELELMIKRSDNDLAAKYSQRVGLDRIQALQQSKAYRFYDPENGGGLWSGKHYGIAEPRSGDPIGDHSHSMTVRQCLRFYLMLAQGRLVSPQASRRMQEVFAAPSLDFHDDNFVAGLKGRDVRMVRKNGLWQDWHLDTALIEHGPHRYALAAAARHPRGQDYLAALAAEVDSLICHDTTTPLPRHERQTLEFPIQWESVAHNEKVSQVQHAAAPFNEALLSWNVDCPPDHGFTVEVRVGRRADAYWTPFLHAGDWGALPENLAKLRICDGGKIDIDYFRSDERFDRLQFRVRSFSSSRERHDALHIRRVTLQLSDTSGLPLPYLPTDADRSVEPSQSSTLAVPFRSQRDESSEIASRICSPTSVAMVLDFHGVRAPTAEVARRLFDVEHDIYGNWPRAVQGAYTFGVPGYLARFSDWGEVEELVARGLPIVISIAAKEGQLSGAPYRSTNGHLLVLRGFDKHGDVLVCDPAAGDANQGVTTYKRDELTTVWMRRGGTSYVFLPPEKEPN